MNLINLGINCINKTRKELNNLKKIKALNNKINVQTNADLLAHKTIINFLKENHIKCDILSEEKEGIIHINGGNKDLIFVVDPLDNSHLFLKKEFCFCSVAIMIFVRGKPEYSFVGDLSNQDIYYCDTKFSYKNGKKIKINNKTIGKGIILGWAPYKLRLKRLYESLIELTDKYYLYNYGGQLQTVKIINGSYDAYIEIRAETINELCAALIVERAGGMISNTKGKKIKYNLNEKQTLIVAKNKKIHKEILSKLKDKNYD